MGSHSGYKGFKSWSGQECPTLKPGESYDSRSTKFSAMGQSIMSTMCVQNPAFGSVYRADFGLVTQADYAMRPAKPCYDDVVAGKKFLGQSLYESDFVHFSNHGKALLAKPKDDFKRVFDALARAVDDDEPNNATVDDPRLPRDRIKELLTTVYGSPPSTRLLEMYSHMFDPIPDGYVTWPIFEEAMDRIHHFVANSVGKLHGKPSWMEYLSLRRLVPSTVPSSSHQIDYGTYGSDPLARPYLSRTLGMASTTSDLADGTTKNTCHIPRYGGFLPEAPHNPIAVAQGDGTVPRNKGADLRLYHLNNIPGYTGHKPVDSKNVRGEATTGTDPRSTNGYIYRPHL
ncbi:hypothetical protein SDRG_13599 [Saprolegnia diclina VS20]|uniref:Uncharacterized protein n=1 Tax=Saprolegnia diclina (strain VS20) TaxID=1156394 RepID=T0Q5L1_SAPDV|nr:hypothetical protein SDRG_13599 [Saprolegnia diclina VS20]EQC28725.1 hypothetical protein SDRG_13599 [Saprolegnia diclina VS20]|eukprot:XP_008617917.1 hypothetical protein SDRG_13599 [Saprolegnia diclina VS20]